MQDWKLTVFGNILEQSKEFTQIDFERLQDTHFDFSRYFDHPGKEVVRVNALLGELEPKASPTHIIFYGSDQFIAEIRMEELNDAFFLYMENGKPLKKSFPLRLYVPDGSSTCLNVKSIVRMELCRYTGEEANKPSSFGFKNQFSPEELLQYRHK